MAIKDNSTGQYSLFEIGGSLDHTSIEEFRNRFGTKGAELITKDMMRVVKEFGFTKGDDADMDTTVQDNRSLSSPREMANPFSTRKIRNGYRTAEPGSNPESRISRRVGWEEAG